VGSDSASLKADTIATKAGEGALGLTLHLINNALGSLSKVFHFLEPVKEFKEFLAFIEWIKDQREKVSRRIQSSSEASPPPMGTRLSVPSMAGGLYPSF
jgi:hypothetical protein